jgi:hypothetical protein
MHTHKRRLPASRRTHVAHALLLAAGLSSMAAAHADETDGQEPGVRSTKLSVLPEDVNVVLGTKLWVNRWSSWLVNSVSSGSASRQVIDPVNSGNSVSVIPQLSVRYRDYLGSLSVMTPTNYTLDQQWVGSSRGRRSEVDMNLGYVITPGLSATVGAKRLTQNFGGKFTWTGPTVGLSGTAALNSGLSAYMAIGLGWMKASLAKADGAGHTSLRSDYMLSEAGVAYSLGNMGWSPLQSAALTFGYRSQVLTTKGYVLNDTSTTTYNTQNVRDTTQGFTLGVVAAF